MKKKYSLLTLACFMVSVAPAQVMEHESALRTASAETIEGWKKGGTIFINVSQTSLTNWAAGGQNSLSINGLVDLNANYKKGKSNWDNSLDIGYGLLKQGKDADLMKTDDKIDLVSKYGYQAFGKWNYALLLNFRTQMSNGYNYPNDSVAISKILAPGYLFLAAGLDYKPCDNFSAFIAPITSKITLVNDQALADSGAFGVDPGKKLMSELGGYIRITFQKDIVKNVSLGTKLDLFSNYLNNPQNIDVNWGTIVTLKANKYLSASLVTDLIYDDDINIELDTNDDGIVDHKGPRTQFKEVISLGLTIKF
jgi:hypothetical protein